MKSKYLFCFTLLHKTGYMRNTFLFCFLFKGRRPSATRKMVFLLTDGRSNIQNHLTLPNANALKKNGVEIFVVAVGNYIHGIDEIVKTASFPPQDYLFRVKNLAGFWNIIKLIVKQVSPDKYHIVNYDPPC